MINSETAGIYFFVPVIIILTFIQGFTPYFIRKTTLFGISIPESEYENPVFNEYRKSYRNENLILGAIVIVLAVIGATYFGDLLYIPIIAIFSQLIISFLIYYKYYRLTKEYKRTSSWQGNTTSIIAVDISSESKGFVSALWLLIFPVITAATIIYSLYVYPFLPDKLPMKFDFAGNVIRYADKSILSVMIMPITQIFMSIIFCFVFYIIKTSRRQIDPQDKEESIRKLNIFRRTWAYFIIFCGSLMVLSMAFAQLTILGILSARLTGFLTLSYTFIVLVAAVVISVKLGQGGSRIKQDKKAGDLISAKDDDKHWIMGVFYYNKDDPALFVEKRFGVGWTSNFARPMTYVFIGILIIIIVATSIFTASSIK